MNRPILFHHLCSFFLLFLYFHHEHLHLTKRFQFKPIPAEIKNCQKQLQDLPAQTQQFILALVFGVTHKLDKDLNQKIKSLNLSHAITPSGLHISLLHPFLLLIPYPLMILVIYFLLFLFIKDLNYYFALERCLLYFVFINLQRSLKIKVSRIVIFYLVFIVSYGLGSYEKSPLSFIFSYIFWGIIILNRNKNFKTTLIHLFISNLIINIFFEKQTSLLFFIFNPILSGLISFSFLVSILFLLIDFPKGLIFISDFNITTIHKVYELFLCFPWFDSLSLLLIIYLLWKGKKSLVFLGMLVLFNNQLNIKEKANHKTIRYLKIMK